VGTYPNETVAFEADRQWIDEHFEMLVRVYADHWIAVQHGRVIASAPDLGELLSHVPDLAYTCIEFINPQPSDLAL